VVLDFCWANVIDPIYCQNLMRQAVSSVPHSKIHGFGSDFGGFGYHPGGGYPDRAWAHAQIARENIAIALSDLIDWGYLDLQHAKDWPAPGFSTIQMNSTDWDWGKSSWTSTGLTPTSRPRWWLWPTASREDRATWPAGDAIWQARALSQPCRICPRGQTRCATLASFLISAHNSVLTTLGKSASIRSESV
jgi:hypothetical protein